MDSVAAQTFPPSEVVLVDNSQGGTALDGIAGRLDQLVHLPQRKNRFFAAGVNAGILASTGKHVLVLNDDAMLDCRWSEEIFGSSWPEDVGAMASVVWRYGTDGLVDSMGDHLDLGGRAGAIGWNQRPSALSSRPYEVFSASASCAVYRRAALAEAGAFDERFIAYLEDVDLGFRLRLLGYRCLLTPAAHAHHIGGATAKRRHRALFLTERNMIWNLWKNMPSQILKRHFPRLASSQLSPAPVVGGGTYRAWLHGKAGALSAKSIWSDRRRIQASARVDWRDIERLLGAEALAVCHL